MEKRIFAAVLVSIGLLWLWAAVAPKLFPDLAKKPAPPKPAVTATTTTAPAPATTSSVGAAAPGRAPESGHADTPAPVTPVAAAAVTITTIDTPNFTTRLSNRGAEIVSFQLKRYTAKDGSPVELVKARDPNRTDFPFAIEAADTAFAQRANSALYEVTDRSDKGARVLQYRWSDGRFSVTKTFRFTNEYLFDFEAIVTPHTPYRLAIGPGIRTLEKEEKDSQFIITGNGVVQYNDDLKVIAREKSDRVNIWPAVQFVGVEDNYFLTVLRPSKAGGAVIRAVELPAENNQNRRELYAALTATPSGVVAGSAFFGPKETYTLDKYDLERTLQYGMFGVVARVLLVALTWINKWTHNYGFAIIVLTFIIKVVLYPLQHKWIVSMKKMQKMQPKMEAIKARYKKAKSDAEQRQKMNQEMMKLYQAEGVNPAGGCLPFALQVPILWGFYNLLTHAIELRHAPFILWIHDLSAKDPYYITPLLMVVTMFIQQAMTPTTGDAMQRRMFMIMPIVLGWIFKELPSGVVIYYLMQNALTILQQWIMNKWWKDHPDDKSVA
ncbi:MAG: membrane protein insertase YidC [Acidobacteriota bacterium]